ncbi:MAG: NAD(P)/FAD-dependent oxidoreductase [bacterium]
MPSKRTDLLVVGGGAAGMMAAGTAAERGLTVVLLEKNDKVGRKLGLTGKGRCNVTNASTPEEVIRSVPTNGRFLFSAVNAFTPRDAMDFFEGLGVPLKVERGGRVFPVSDRAGDIVNALRFWCQRAGVTVLHETAEALLLREGRAAGVKTNRGEHLAANVLLTTGGASYPLTGSTGDGYRLAASAGHTIVPPKPSLVALCSEDDCCPRMQGFSLKNIAITVKDDRGKAVYEDFGELLFTHFGVSGPVILSASAHMRSFDKRRYTLYIDLKPALDGEKLDARLLRDFEKYRNREFRNALSDLAGRSMIPLLVERSGIPPEKQVNAITREERRRLLALFKAFPVPISGPAPLDTAIITSGGVSVKEIDPKTMASRLCPGLWFAGELIDVDAYTGGFNLQIAWATARAAGNSIEGERT